MASIIKQIEYLYNQVKCLWVKIDECCTGSELPQDNLFLYRGTLLFTDSTAIIDRALLANSLNTSPPLVVTEVEIPLITASIRVQDTPGGPVTAYTIKWVFNHKGKGTYGTGGTQLTEDDVIIIYNAVTTYNDVVISPTTQVIDFGEIGTTPVSTFLNASPGLPPSPPLAPIILQNQDEGYVIFKTLDNGLVKDYLFLNVGGAYGLHGTLTSIEDDFQLLNDQDGVITTPSLQMVIDVNKVADRVEFSKVIYNGQSVTPLPINSPPGTIGTNYIKKANSGGYFILGNFNTYGTSSSQNFVKIKEDGSVDSSFNRLPAAGFRQAAGYYMYEGSSFLELPDGTIYVGGTFISWNGIPCGSFIKLLADGSIDNTFNTTPILPVLPKVGFSSGGSTGQAFVTGFIRLTDGSLIVIGKFTTWNGTVIPTGIVKIDPTGAIGSPTVSTFNSGNVGFAGNGVTPNFILDLKDGTIVVGGYFSTYRGVTVNGIVKIDAVTGARIPFPVTITPPPTQTGSTVFTSIRGIVTPSDQILLAGAFTQINGVDCGSIARIDFDGTLDPTFNVGQVGFPYTYPLNSIKFLNSSVDKRYYVLGGTFTSYNGVISNGSLIIDLEGNIHENPPGDYLYAQYYDGALLTLNGDGDMVVVVDGIEYKNYKQALTFSEVTGKAEYNALMLSRTTSEELLPKRLIEQLIIKASGAFVPTLQQVTGEGNETDDSIIFRKSLTEYLKINTGQQQIEIWNTVIKPSAPIGKISLSNFYGSTDDLKYFSLTNNELSMFDGDALFSVNASAKTMLLMGSLLTGNSLLVYYGKQIGDAQLHIPNLGNTTKTLPISVNGQIADEFGNIDVSSTQDNIPKKLTVGLNTIGAADFTDNVPTKLAAYIATLGLTVSEKEIYWFEVLENYTQPVTINFDIESSNWGGGVQPITNQATFTTFLSDQGLTNIVITNFSIVNNGSLKCGLSFTGTSLDLQVRNITKINTLTNLPTLVELYLGSNNLTTVDGIDLPTLTTLYVPSNQMSTMQGLTHLPGLTDLTLDSNNIVTIQGLTALPNLSYLSLANNGIVTIQGLSSLVNLTQLGLYSNNITTLQGLNSLVNLLFLSISNNKITTISDISPMVGLKYLYLINNLIDVTNWNNLGPWTAIALSGGQLQTANNTGIFSAATTPTPYNNLFTKGWLIT